MGSTPLPYPRRSTGVPDVREAYPLRRRIAVVGAGWTGAVAGRLLTDAGFAVEVMEKTGVVGGHSRAETMNGVVYEPNGAHIFHTSNAAVNKFVNAHGLNRP